MRKPALPTIELGRLLSPDGCRNRCSFCIVTVARGNERSRKLDGVAEAQHLSALGYKELLITGVHLGGYGSDIQEKSHHTDHSAIK